MKFMHEFALKPGSQEEYKRRHDALWPEQYALMLEAGIRNYTIWNTGTRLIEYFETDDIERVGRVLSGSNVKKRWDAYMRDILVFNEEGGMTPLTLLFEFSGKE